MRFLLFLFISLAPGVLGAQRLEVLSAGGGQLTAPGLTIDMTIGEALIGVVDGGDEQATVGFQQSVPAATTLAGTEAAPAPAGDIAVWPNPATSRLTVAFTGEPAAADYRLRVLTTQGQRVAEYTAAGDQTSIDVARLVPGHYWLVADPGEGRPVRSFMFQKL